MFFHQMAKNCGNDKSKHTDSSISFSLLIQLFAITSDQTNQTFGLLHPSTCLIITNLQSTIYNLQTTNYKVLKTVTLSDLQFFTLTMQGNVP